MKRICSACGGRKPNIHAKLCRNCCNKWLATKARGRSIPNRCQRCDGPVSTKVAKFCRKCYMTDASVRPKVVTKGQKAWNAGMSKFSDKEDYRRHANAMRRERYRSMTAISRLPDLVRTRIRNSFNAYLKRGVDAKKSCSSTTLLGCSFADFKKYIESKMLPGMTWGNYGNRRGQWNIDHIKPVSSFDLTRVDEQLKCFHYSNCRPLWAILNIKKGNKQGQAEAAVLTVTVTY